MQLYYTVKEIKEKENCGRDAAYKIASKLPHEIRGRKIYVFAEDYENFYKEKRAKALKRYEELKKKNEIIEEEEHTVYQMRRLG